GRGAGGAQNERAEQRSAAGPVATLKQLVHQRSLVAVARAGPRLTFTSFGAVIPIHTRRRRTFITFTMMLPDRTMDVPRFWETTSMPAPRSEGVAILFRRGLVQWRCRSERKSLPSLPETERGDHKTVVARNSRMHARS